MENGMIILQSHLWAHTQRKPWTEWTPAPGLIAALFTRQDTEATQMPTDRGVDPSAHRQRRGPECPPTEAWIRNMWHICTMEYYFAIKNHEIMPFAANMPIDCQTE